MKTLKEIAIDRKARKGESSAITADGAYWLPVNILVSNGGGDGIGCNSPDIDQFLQVRHYRGGEVRCYITRETWHQNHGTHTTRTRADDVLNCETVEDIISTCKRHKFSGDYEDDPVLITDAGEERLAKELPEMTVSLPAPDET